MHILSEIDLMRNSYVFSLLNWRSFYFWRLLVNQTARTLCWEVLMTGFLGLVGFGSATSFGYCKNAWILDPETCAPLWVLSCSCFMAEYLFISCEALHGRRSVSPASESDSRGLRKLCCSANRIWYSSNVLLSYAAIFSLQLAFEAYSTGKWRSIQTIQLCPEQSRSSWNQHWTASANADDSIRESFFYHCSVARPYSYSFYSL